MLSDFLLQFKNDISFDMNYERNDSPTGVMSKRWEELAEDDIATNTQFPLVPPRKSPACQHRRRARGRSAARVPLQHKTFESAWRDLAQNPLPSWL